MQIVAQERPEIARVELIGRESNRGPIRLYERHGFRREGRFEGRIRNPDGSLEADIPMAWVRPGPAQREAWPGTAAPGNPAILAAIERPPADPRAGI